ncbi:polysaccharide deacetylase family protein [Mariprofundus sp. KV]|uniref:polysaccharide deacetylase family protein n=1 Tax=Mariprofundus sp. KV TaxID=2608715 RepID=UPI0015A322B0|nr:polysaccharide deacetylase family protein [Mariprofundus sp. KV]NWF35543.1 polysaccharide deacetylase family protein [Mariprofundus sp. KV]
MKVVITNSLKWKRRLGRIYTLLGSRSADRRVILIYHSVGGGELATGVEQFRQQMTWLAEHTDVMALDNLLAQRSGDNNGRPKVALTFDDGYRSVHDTAAPILAEYGFPATVYLNSGHIRDDGHETSDAGQGHYPDEEFMSWDEVLELQRQDWTIGSHGVLHLDLTQQTESVISKELIDSKMDIERRIGMPCDHFSYTWGHNNSLVRNTVRDTGYKTATACIHRALNTNADRFALPRLDIRQDYSIKDFASVVMGAWDFLYWTSRFRRGVYDK